MASSVVGTIEPRLRLSEIERAARKPTESLDAYDLFLRALSEGQKPDPERRTAAIELAHRALAIDPSYAPAAALIGAVRASQARDGIPITDSDIDDALRLVRRALDAGRDDPDVLWRSGQVLAMLAGEHAAALNAIDRALTLNPNSAPSWASSAIVNCYANRPDAAILAIQRAMQLSPLDPLAYAFKFVLAYAMMLAGRYEEALEWVDRSLHDRSSNHAAIRGKVALCGYLGRTEEARKWVRRRSTPTRR